MLKKLFSTFFVAVMILFVANTQAQAAKIVVLLDAPVGTFTEPEKVYQIVQDSLGRILNGSSGYEILPPSETENYIQIYREEHDMISSTGADEGQHDEKWFKKDDINSICSHFGGNYAVYIRVTSTAPKHSAGLFSNSSKMNVVTDFRVWSNAKKDFSYMKRATAQGTSTAIYMGVGSSSRALEKGLKKGLEEVEKDKVKIFTALSE